MQGSLPTEESNPWSGLTVRSLLLGILMVVIINVGAPYSYNILHSSLLACDYLPLGLVFPFIVIVVLLNLILKLINPRLALRPSELIIVFIMGLVGSTIATNLTGYLLGIIAAPHYFASPENQWGDYLYKYMPNWVTLDGKGSAVKWFFEGLPEGEKIPWGAWIIPLIWWLSLIIVILFVCLCIVAILKRQWVNKEKLVFPLSEVPLEMIKGSDNRSLLPTFMRSRTFWIGFAIPLFIVVWNIAGYFTPLFPQIPLKGSIQVGRSFPAITTEIFFPLIGFAFLANLDVLLSVWFFCLLSVIQVGIYNRVGFSIGSADVYCSRYPSMGWQGFGALIVMVLWGLWMARGHLRDVFRKAFNRNCDVDDSKELLSYRTAVFGLIFGLMYTVGWLHQSGMSYKVAFVFLFAALIIYIGVTRIVIESGLVFLRGPLIPQSFTIHTLGSSSISGPSMTALAFSYAWVCDLKSFFMPAAAHATKLSDEMKLKKEAVLLAIGISIMLGLFVSILYTLHIGYHHGAYNFGGHIFRGGCTIPFESIVNKMLNPFGPDWRRLFFLGVGGIVMAGLMFMRYRFMWWPLHPVGFTVASTLPISRSALSIFIAWAAKSIILKLGGVKLYKSARPLFFGLICGYFIGAGLSLLVDVIWFPGQGHTIYGW